MTSMFVVSGAAVAEYAVLLAALNLHRTVNRQCCRSSPRSSLRLSERSSVFMLVRGAVGTANRIETCGHVIH